MVHGSVDWFWEIPALSAPAFAFLGAACALEPGRERTASAPALVPLAGAGVALALFGSAYVGERELSDRTGACRDQAGRRAPPAIVAA